MIFLPITAFAECDKNSLSYLNCNAGQLVDVCGDTAYWKVRIDCCDQNSNYRIDANKIETEQDVRFYKDYMRSFDEQVYHCALKIGEIKISND